MTLPLTVSRTSSCLGKEGENENRSFDRILRRLKLHAEGRQFGGQNSRTRASASNRLTLIPSSGGAFEVRANGKLLHSKLDSGDWPDFDAVVSRDQETQVIGRSSIFPHSARPVRRMPDNPFRVN